MGADSRGYGWEEQTRPPPIQSTCSRLNAIREDEVLAQTLGINTTRYKLLAFAVSSGFAGLAGGLYAYYVQLVSPTVASATKLLDAVKAMTETRAGAVTVVPSALDPEDSTGELWWGGIAGTHWWISPKTNMAGALMTQREWSSWHPFIIEFKRLVYRAVGSART